MSEIKVTHKEKFEIGFPDEKWQTLAKIIFEKKESLSNTLEREFGISFERHGLGTPIEHPIKSVSFWGYAGSETKLQKALDVLMADFEEQKYFSKKAIVDIATQINLTGKYSEDFNRKAANQNRKGAFYGGFVAKNKAQEEFYSMISANDLTFGVGPAGTGKTHVAIAKAVEALEKGEIDRILLARPAVTSGKDLGALPGELEDKLAPYMMPLYDELRKTLGPDKLKQHRARGVIEIVPVEMMRGRTFTNAYVVVDEAQNCTREQMKMALTRIGEGSRMIVTGDPMQTDLKDKSDSGLKWAYEKLRGIEGIGVQFFDAKDIVRHTVVQRIVTALDDNNEANPGQNLPPFISKKAAPGPKPVRFGDK